MWVDNGKDKGFSYARLHQANETGASILAVACPYCMLSLEASNLANNGNRLKLRISRSWPGSTLALEVKVREKVGKGKTKK